MPIPKRLTLWGVAILAALAGLNVGACSGDESCAVCMREKCADLISICERDADCACMTECTGARGIPGVGACLAECGLAARSGNFARVEECTAVACPDTGDECSTPGGWQPAEEPIVCRAADASTLGGGQLSDCAFDAMLAFDPDGSTLQLQSEDGDVCVRVERRSEGSGALANTQWALLEMQVGPLGEVALVNEATDLCWYSSHHNFRDWAHGWSGQRHFDLVAKQDGHGGERTYELYVYEQGPLNSPTCAATTDGSRCLAGPIALVPFAP